MRHTDIFIPEPLICLFCPAQFQSGDACGDIQPRAGFSAQRLKAEIFRITADECIGTQSQPDRNTRRSPDIAAGKSTLACPIGRNAVDDPTQIGLVGDTDVDTELADRTRIVLWPAGTPGKLAIDRLRGADEHSDAPGNVARQGTQPLFLAENHLGHCKLNASKARFLDYVFGSSDAKACDLVPFFHGYCSKLAMMAGWDVVAGNMKEIGDRVVDGNEALKLPR